MVDIRRIFCAAGFRGRGSADHADRALSDRGSLLFRSLIGEDARLADDPSHLRPAAQELGDESGHPTSNEMDSFIVHGGWVRLCHRIRRIAHLGTRDSRNNPDNCQHIHMDSA